MEIIVLNDKKYNDVKNINLLEIDFYKKQIDLSIYKAIVFTSKNGVFAIDKIDKKWKNLEIYSIGEATTKTIENFDAKVTYMAKESYGDSFANELIDRLKNKKSIYIRPKKVVSTLCDILKKNNIDIDEEILYQTNCKKCNPIHTLSKNSVVIFSSPSIIECFFKCFSWDSSYKAIVIGTKTAQYMPQNIDYIISPKQDINFCIQIAKNLEGNL